MEKKHTIKTSIAMLLLCLLYKIAILWYSRNCVFHCTTFIFRGAGRVCNPHNFATGLCV